MSFTAQQSRFYAMKTRLAELEKATREQAYLVKCLNKQVYYVEVKQNNWKLILTTCQI